tara:strand:+ start:121 stop:906 length:786 start_codon:yes stop_codon:yes gene_type:complete
MSKGFLWFAQNNSKTDYVALSIKLAKSIKRYNRENKICVVTDKDSEFKSEYVDVVKVLNNDDSADHDVKWANEHKAFKITPFTHTIKLEADMLWTINTDWWWHHLWQHDMVFSIDCLDYRDKVIVDKTYRKLFIRNNLPNLYNGLVYFRRSTFAQKFFTTAEIITKNWNKVRSEFLIDCHDTHPSTDVVYALAYRLLDPTQQYLVNYDWFKFIHNKNAIHGLSRVQNYNDYLMTHKNKDKIYIGENRVSRVFHYHDKELDV